MSEYEKKDAFNSPMEVVYSWATPSTGESMNATKRKSQDDSGYGSPVSSKRPNIHSVSGTDGDSGFFTPRVSGRPSKRLEVNAAGNYLDLDESLYSEPSGAVPLTPKDVELVAPESLYTPPESLSESEITKDLEGAIASCSISPIIPSSRRRALSTACPSTPRKNRLPLKRAVSSAPTVLWHQPKARQYLNDYEKLDIIYELGVRMELPNVLDNIFGYLSDSDLSNMTMVNSNWKRVCLANSKAKKRWQSYTDARKQNRENLHARPTSTEGKPKKTSLGNHDINHSTPLVQRQPKSPPVSPSRARFNSILKVSKNMSDNDVLVMCPSCRRPYAVPKSSGVAVCASLNCQYKFCMLCKSAHHPNRPCPLLTPTTPTKLYHNKRKSIRNLRRL